MLQRLSTKLIQYNGEKLHTLIEPLLEKVNPIIRIPEDYPSLYAVGEYLTTVNYDNQAVVVEVAAGTYRETKSLHEVFGTKFGNGRIQIVGKGVDVTTFEFLKCDGIYAGHGTCFGHAPQYPVSEGDIHPIFKNCTLSGINRDDALDDPYKDAMGVRAFDGGLVVLDDTVRITNFSRVGVMAERHGIAFTPGTKVDTTGSDCFAASEGGYIYAPNTIADSPKGHCYIGYSGGQLYMPNSQAKNAALHGNVGGSGLVLTGHSYAYAINLQVTGCAQRPVSVAMGSVARCDALVEEGNSLPVSVSQNSTLFFPNAVIKKPSGQLALLIEKGGEAYANIASQDKLEVTGRITVQSMGILHAPNGTIANSSGNSLSAINSTVDVDRVTFTGAPAVAIYAQDGARVKCVNGSSETTSGSSIIAQNAEVSADNFRVGGNPSTGFRANNGGRIFAKNAVVQQAGQYGYIADGLGAYIDASSSSCGNAFTGYKVLGGGQILATGAQPTGQYGDAAYNPVVNTPTNHLGIIAQ